MQNFDEYIRQGEPSQKEKAEIWQTAIGLQDVDRLKPSEYLLETAKENIENKITINEVLCRIDSYYKQQSNRKRNALVRANYNDLKNNIKATTEYLMRFFGNLLLGENNTLKNREMLINWKNETDFQSAKTEENKISKSNICTLNCTLEEHFVLDFLKNNPKATQKEIAAHIHKSERTVKTITTNLQQKGLLERKNGKRNGFWEI